MERDNNDDFIISSAWLVNMAIDWAWSQVSKRCLELVRSAWNYFHLDLQFTIYKKEIRGD